MVTLKEIPIQGYEKVVQVDDAASGLHGYIVVHNSKIGHAADGLGFALGGCRRISYTSDHDALIDNLRLAESMTNKSAVAENKVGGGKSVVIAKPENVTPEQEERIFEAMGEAIEEFNNRYPESRYVAAEDMGTGIAQMKIMARKTKSVAGIGYDQFDGNPSPFTAGGVLVAMKEALGVETMAGKKVAIAGVGHVGKPLAEMLLKEGAELFIADINQSAIDDVKQLGGSRVTVVRPDEIHKQDVDVYAPCAGGACLNDETVPEIKAPVICGAANNQQKDASHGRMLYNDGKIYVPDYIANEAGVIAIRMEIEHREKGIPLTEEMIRDVTEDIVRRNTREILSLSKTQNIPHSEAATQLAEEKLRTVVLKPQGNWAAKNSPAPPVPPASDPSRRAAGGGLGHP